MKIKFIDEQNSTLFEMNISNQTESDETLDKELAKFDNREVISVLTEFKEGQTAEMGIDFFNSSENPRIVKQITVKFKD